MGNLENKKCRACEGEADLLSKESIQNFISQIKEWNLNKNKIEKNFEFKNFKEALDFVNKVGEIAESEGHHPDIKIFDWNKVKISTHSHSLGGLSENDFILAFKIDKI